MTGDCGDARVPLVTDQFLKGFTNVIEFQGWYNSSMKEKTSITLSKEVLAGIDRIAGSKQSRSAFIEAVLTQYLRKRARAQVEARDLELINKAANELNAEVEDILWYQDPEA
jgi:Arc/MetJ family transcription regulator